MLDIYPAQAADPLLALLEKPQTPAGDAARPPHADRRPRPPPPRNRRRTPPPAETARAPAAAAAAHARAAPSAPIIVAIDAGHGGEDPGARGRRGTHEKDVTLAIARKLKARDRPRTEHARAC